MENKFEKFLQGKLKDDRVPFKEEYWGEMEKLLDRKKKRRPFFIWWFSGIGLVAIASLVFAFWPVDKGSGNGENNKISIEQQAPEMAVEKEEYITGQGKTELPTKSNTGGVEKVERSNEQEYKSNTAINDGRGFQRNKEISLNEHNSGSPKILDAQKRSEENISIEDNSGDEESGLEKDLNDVPPVTEIQLIPQMQEVFDLDIKKSNISGKPTFIRSEKIKPIETVFELNIFYAIPIENIPEPKIKGPWSIGIQAGLFAYAETFKKNTFTMVGPTAGIVIARNIAGPYRLMGAFNYSTFKLDDRNVQSLSEPAYGFGKEDRMRSMIANRVHLLDVPISVSREIGPLWLDLGAGVEWLTGVRARIRDEDKIPAYSLANRVFVQSTQLSEEAVWMEDNSISNFRGFVRLGVNMPLGSDFEIGVSGRYYFSDMGNSSGNDIEAEIIEGSTRMLLSGSVKYWIK